MRNDLWKELGAYLRERAEALKRAGAELLMCVSNTLHKAAPVFTAGLSIPFVHIVDPTGAAIRDRGLTKVGLLGTRPVMATDFLARRYSERFDVEVAAPSPSQQDVIDRIIFEELCRGRFREESKRAYLEMIDDLENRGAQEVILGCTEIPMLVGRADRPDLPMFDTTSLHVAAAVDLALETSIPAQSLD